MRCKRVRQVMYLVVDNECEQDLLISFEEHLTHCPHCAQEMAYTRRLVTVLRERCKRAHASASLRQRILMSLPHRGTPRGKEWK